VARVVGHTATKVRIELRIDEEDWQRLRGQYPSEGCALRALRRVFEDGVRVALGGSLEAVDGDWERFE
jgi:hypothetical protein